jgi:hypothetical protein
MPQQSSFFKIKIFNAICDDREPVCFAEFQLQNSAKQTGSPFASFTLQSPR